MCKFLFKFMVVVEYLNVFKEEARFGEEEEEKKEEELICIIQLC